MSVYVHLKPCITSPIGLISHRLSGVVLIRSLLPAYNLFLFTTTLSTDILYIYIHACIQTNMHFKLITTYNCIVS